MEKDLNYLINKSNILRKHVIEMVARQGKGYVQQGLGASDLFTVLFFGTTGTVSVLSLILINSISRRFLRNSYISELLSTKENHKSDLSLVETECLCLTIAYGL